MTNEQFVSTLLTSQAMRRCGQATLTVKIQTPFQTDKIIRGVSGWPVRLMVVVKSLVRSPHGHHKGFFSFDHIALELHLPPPFVASGMHSSFV